MHDLWRNAFRAVLPFSLNVAAPPGPDQLRCKVPRRRVTHPSGAKSRVLLTGGQSAAKNPHAHASSLAVPPFIGWRTYSRGVHGVR